MLQYWAEHDPEPDFSLYLSNGNTSGDTKLTILFFRDDSSIVAISLR